MGSKYGKRKYGVNAYSRWYVRFGVISEIHIPFVWFARVSYDATFSGIIQIYFDFYGGDTVYIGDFWRPDVPEGEFWVPDIPEGEFWIPDVPENGSWVPVNG
jgi:hypothetical protein